MLYTMWRLARGGLVVAVAVAAASWAIERARLGASDRDAVARVESELRQRFTDSVGRLGRIATEVAAARAAIRFPSGQVAVGRLFDAVSAAMPGRDAGR